MISRLAKLRGEREEGFTLIELLVVIIIIGILAAIAIPVFLNQRQRAQDSATVSAVKSFTTAAESYLVANPTAANFGANAATINTNLRTNEGARSSTGVTIRVSGGANGYQICGFNASGKQYTADATALVFSSAAGTTAVGDCSAATFTTVAP